MKMRSAARIDWKICFIVRITPTNCCSVYICYQHCFKYRTKLDNEMFDKALNVYATDKKKNLSNLSSYVKKMWLKNGWMYRSIADVAASVLARA